MLAWAGSSERHKVNNQLFALEPPGVAPHPFFFIPDLLWPSTHCTVFWMCALFFHFSFETNISDAWPNESSCCNSISLDTEWRSDLINSRHFDKEIGHQNPRCSVIVILLSSCNIKTCFFVCVCLLVAHPSLHPWILVRWQLRVSQWWPLKSELDLSFCLKVPAVNAQSTQADLPRCCHSTERSLGFLVSSAGLVEMIDNYQTLSLKDFTATDLDPFLSIHDDYFYHTQTPRKPEVSSAYWGVLLLLLLLLHRRVVELHHPVLFLPKGRGCACQVLLCWAE